MSDFDTMRAALLELRADVDRLIEQRAEDERQAEAAMARHRAAFPNGAVVKTLDGPLLIPS